MFLIRNLTFIFPNLHLHWYPFLVATLCHIFKENATIWVEGGWPLCLWISPHFLCVDAEADSYHVL